VARFSDPVPALKRRVADEILLLLDGWTQEYAANFMGATQSRMSELRRGKLERFSLDRLVRYLARLGREIQIVTTKRATLSVLDHRAVDGIAATARVPSEVGGREGSSAR
jgi:predicted XRE-type DNA-binding protein